MAKNSYQRAQVERLQAKWSKIRKIYNDPDYGSSVSEKSLSFGRIFSTDPLDCGKADCNTCGSCFIKNQKKRERFDRHVEDKALTQYWFEEL